MCFGKRRDDKKIIIKLIKMMVREKRSSFSKVPSLAENDGLIRI